MAVCTGCTGTCVVTCGASCGGTLSTNTINRLSKVTIPTTKKTTMDKSPSKSSVGVKRGEK